MTSGNPPTDKQLDVLHDHYKETFARILNVEKSRDRLFLAVIGLFALLCLEIGYPAAFGGSLPKVNIAGGEFQLAALPLPALLNITWALTLVITLQYCRTTVWLDRQYPYLHDLEEAISPAVGGNLYRREGKAYLNEYPLLLDVTWFAYSILFPFIIMSAAALLVIWEFTHLSYPLLHLVFDAIMTIILICLLLLYRVEPYVDRKSKRWRKFKTRKSGVQTVEQSDATPKQDVFAE